MPRCDLTFYRIAFRKRRVEGKDPEDLGENIEKVREVMRKDGWQMVTWELKPWELKEEE